MIFICLPGDGICHSMTFDKNEAVAQQKKMNAVRPEWKTPSWKI